MIKEYWEVFKVPLSERCNSMPCTHVFASSPQRNHLAQSSFCYLSKDNSWAPMLIKNSMWTNVHWLESSHPIRFGDIVKRQSWSHVPSCKLFENVEQTDRCLTAWSQFVADNSFKIVEKQSACRLDTNSFFRWKKGTIFRPAQFLPRIVQQTTYKVCWKRNHFFSCRFRQTCSNCRIICLTN